MSKFHRSPIKGTSEICRANVRPCPYGATSEHFSTKVACDEYCDFINEIESYSLSELEKFSKIDEPNYDTHRTILFKKLQQKNVKQFSLNNIKADDFKDGDSGASINLNNNVYVSNGFAVSPYPEYSKAIKGELTDTQLKSVLKDYIKEHKEVLSQPNHILGLWKSPFDDNLYIDVSIVTDNASVAREISLDKDQQAYFDFQTFTAITVNENATSGQ